MPTLVSIALVLSGLAALLAGSGGTGLILLGAAVVWGFLCGLSLLACLAEAVRDWWRGS